MFDRNLSTLRVVKLIGLPIVFGAIGTWFLTLDETASNHASPASAEHRSSGHSHGSETGSGRESIAITAYPLNLSPEDAVQTSDLVIQGRVRSLSAARWNTADGAKPADFDPAGVPGRYMVYRTAIVDISRVLSPADTEALDIVEVTVFGGEVDGLTVSVSDWGPVLVPGDDVVLFLTEPSQEELVKTNWHAVQYFTITEGGVARNELVSLPVAELAKRIAAAR